MTEVDGKPAKVMGLPVTWVDEPVALKLTPALRRS